MGTDSTVFADELSPRRRVVIVLLILALVAAASAAVTLALTSTDDDSVLPTVASSIGVRGDWVIEVRNPDGTLADGAEFHNDLDATGITNLTHILTDGERDRWSIIVRGAAVGDSAGCLSQFDDPAPQCTIVEGDPAPPTWPTSPQTFFGVTALPVPEGDDFPTAVELRGSYTTTADGTIGAVWTGLPSCLVRDGDPTNCALEERPVPSVGFTRATLPEPVSVVEGQQVLVVVTISFTSA